ncbi:hypothetical protein EDB86DRAFT_2809522 [Lactarius hatsudake]|nr:hypothetical protein EDB86DRAFT_2809522 [Lactarius hatsudake]
MGFSCSVCPDCGSALTVFFEGSVFMLVSSTAPSKRSLDALNGLTQTVVSTQRAVEPAAASLFAFSLQNNVLGGQFAYVVLLSLAYVGLGGRTTSEEYSEVSGQSRSSIGKVAF